MIDVATIPWWLVVFAAIGLLTIVGSILSLFTSFGGRPKKIAATSSPPVDSDEFLAGIAGAVNAPLRRGGRAELLNNGDEFFPQIVSAIQQATKTVNFSTYTWASGRASDMVLDALIERARAGVQVRLLLDGFGGLRAPKVDLERLKEAGGEVRWFRAPRLVKIFRFHRRNHRRAIVIDGKVGFTGGASVGDKWLGNGRHPNEWRDSMVRLTGSLASGLQSAFAGPWAYTCGEMLVGPEFYAPDDPADDNLQSRHVHLVSSPSSEEHPMRLFLILSFVAARRKLYIAASYFVPDEQTRRAVAERARAGVDVRILVPGPQSKAQPIRLAGRGYYEVLLRSGVRIYEYEPTRIHSKLVVIDEQWSIVGSANMDVRSKELNHENVIGIHDRDLAAQIERTFLEDLERSREIRLEEWQARNLWERVKERFWGLFVEQY